MHMQTHMHMHTHMHTHMQTHMHMHNHAHAHAYTSMTGEKKKPPRSVASRTASPLEIRSPSERWQSPSERYATDAAASVRAAING